MKYIEDLESNIRALLDKHSSLQQKHSELIKENSELKSALEAFNREDIHPSRPAADSHSGKAALDREELNEYIKQIDRCINLVSEL